MTTITRDQLTKAIVQLREIYVSKGLAIDYKDINHGHCVEFAEEIVSLFGGQQISNDWFDNLENQPYHSWIKFDGMYFDCECPEGVKDYMDLPFFKRLFSREE